MGFHKNRKGDKMIIKKKEQFIITPRKNKQKLNLGLPILREKLFHPLSIEGVFKSLTGLCVLFTKLTPAWLTNLSAKRKRDREIPQ